jgi:hypothetical protein
MGICGARRPVSPSACLDYAQFATSPILHITADFSREPRAVSNLIGFGSGPSQELLPRFHGHGD